MPAIGIEGTDGQIVTSDELQAAYKHAVSTWKSWDSARKASQLNHLSSLANDATALGDPDLADNFDGLGEIITADLERRAVAL